MACPTSAVAPRFLSEFDESDEATVTQWAGGGSDSGDLDEERGAAADLTVTDIEDKFHPDNIAREKRKAAQWLANQGLKVADAITFTEQHSEVAEATKGALEFVLANSSHSDTKLKQSHMAIRISNYLGRTLGELQ